MILLNGLATYYKKFESKYTFYRGKLFSQNDLVFSNDISYVDSLKILEKNIYSFHCLISVSCTVLISVSLDDLKNYSNGCFNDDHYGGNKRLNSPINLSYVNMKQAIDLMKVFAEDLKNELPNLNINHLSSKISNCIYNACRNSYEKRSPPNPTIQPKLSNCNSKNFRAIANANMTRYITLIESNISNDNINEYLDNWMKFE